MAIKTELQERLERKILQDQRNRKANWKKSVEEERQRLQQVLNSNEPTRSGLFIMLYQCTPGTRFVYTDDAAKIGMVLGVTPCSVRVLFDNGTDTTVSRNVEVFTGPPKAPKQPRKSPERKADAKPPAPEPPRRPRVLGYTSCRIIAWAGERGWDFAKVKLLFEAFEVPVSDSTIWMYLDSWKDPKNHDPAKVTPEDAIKIERAVE